MCSLFCLSTAGRPLLLACAKDKRQGGGETTPPTHKVREDADSAEKSVDKTHNDNWANIDGANDPNNNDGHANENEDTGWTKYEGKKKKYNKGKESPYRKSKDPDGRNGQRVP